MPSGKPKKSKPASTEGEQASPKKRKRKVEREKDAPSTSWSTSQMGKSKKDGISLLGEDVTKRKEKR